MSQTIRDQSGHLVFPIVRLKHKFVSGRWDVASCRVSENSILRFWWPPWSLIGWDIFHLSFEFAEPNSTKHDRKEDLNVLYHVCVFFPVWSEKEDGPDLWFAETFLYSSQKPLNRIQRNLKEIKILMQLPSLFLGRMENKIVVPVSDWLRHFWFLPLNCWAEFKQTWQKATSQCPLLCLCFSDRSDEQNSSKLDGKQHLNVLCYVCVFRIDRTSSQGKNFN